jgi:hypothetical protein
MKSLAQLALCCVFGFWIQYLDSELFFFGFPWHFWSVIMVLLGVANSSESSPRYFGGWTIFFCLCLQALVFLKYLVIVLLILGYEPTAIA